MSIRARQKELFKIHGILFLGILLILAATVVLWHFSEVWAFVFFIVSFSTYSIRWSFKYYFGSMFRRLDDAEEREPRK